LISSLTSPSAGSTGRLFSSNFRQVHSYHVSGTFLVGHSQSSQGFFLSNREEWKTQRSKNGAALTVVISSAVDKYMRMCSRSSGSSRTFDEALLGCLSLLKQVGGGGGVGSLSLKKNQFCVTCEIVSRNVGERTVYFFLCCSDIVLVATGKKNEAMLFQDRECDCDGLLAEGGSMLIILYCTPPLWLCSKIRYEALVTQDGPCSRLQAAGFKEPVACRTINRIYVIPHLLL